MERGADSPDVHLIVSPVGADTDLRAALEDLKMGRYLSARDLLARTGPNWALRTIRSQLLAAGAGEPGVFKTWRDEEPNNQDAAMMWGRVLTNVALAAYRGNQDHAVVARAAGLARQALYQARVLLPECPVPWVDLLRLTQLPFAPHHFDPHAHTRGRPWDALKDPAMHHRGPWPLLTEINQRHAGNREGHHRMREWFLSRSREPGAAMNYSCWLVAMGTLNPQLLVMPLYALMDLYRQRHGDGRGGALQFWQTAQVRHYACKAYDDWFADIPPVEYPWLPLPDLSYLAHALVACGENERAAYVFRAMGPYVTPQPWQDINASLGRSADWRDEFLRIRASVLR
ncbi:hypothetical protein [Streptomyces sp. NPDC006668]|uniref:hypothetical protein n=1 Tax=Streptomyces sp. NPDC006668 TaxID=3156903 RepID=UPI0033F0A858